MNLVLRPSGISSHPWSLQLRSHASLGETEYLTLWRGNREVADMIIEAGAAEWLFGEPDSAPKG